VSTFTRATTASQIALAGGLVTNTTQTIPMLRNVARDATMEVDGAYSNPAGSGFIDEGFHAIANFQSVWQTRDVTTTFAPLAYKYGDATHKYDGVATAPFIPSVQAVYKSGKWAFSGNFSFVGGGGTAEFENGVATLDLIPFTVAQGIGAQYGMPIQAPASFDWNSYLKGSQTIFGMQLGATYNILDNFAAYVGARMCLASSSYDIYVHDINVANIAKVNLDIDAKQKGVGFCPIIGVDYKLGDLNLAARYEFNTSIDMKNETKKDIDQITVNGNTVASGMAGMYKDGEKVASDMPSLLAVGAEYQLNNLKLEVAYHFYDDKHADYNGKEEFLDGGTHEILAGAEYKINDKFLLSCGGQRTIYGITDDYISDLSFTENSTTFACGAVFSISENLKLNANWFHTWYDDYTETYMQNGLELTNKYERGNNVDHRKNSVFTHKSL